MRSPIVLLTTAAVILCGAAPGRAEVSSSTFPQPDLWPRVSVIDHVPSETLGPGVTYDRWQLRTRDGPLTIHITTVDLRNPAVALKVATHNGGQIVGTGEALSAIADRSHAEAAINGDYFDINETGTPLNIVGLNGRIVHQPDGAAALLVGPGNAVTMGPATVHATIANTGGAKLDVTLVNEWSKEDGLALLTPEFGVAADAADADADMQIVLAPLGSSGASPAPAASPPVASPPAASPSAASPPAVYRVASVSQTLGHLLPLGPNDLALVARGAEQVGRLSALASNDPVTVNFTGEPPPSSYLWAVGGGPLLLSDGKVVVDPTAPAPQETNVRYPVTGAGLSADGSRMWLVVVDGRAPKQSIGITRPMLRSLLAALGAAQAMAFDSGGSSEMTVRHLGDPTVSVANTPSDGKERSIADALLVVNTATPGAAAQLLLRSVAPVVLSGSHLPLQVTAIDANMQPVQLDTASLHFDLSSNCCLVVDAIGVATGGGAGTTDVAARSGGIASAPLSIDVVHVPDALAISGYGRNVPAGGTAALSLDAWTRERRHIAVDATAVSWSATGEGSVAANGAFTAGPAPGIATVTARVAGVSVSLNVLVGEHPVQLASKSWQFKASPSSVGGAVDDTSAPDGAKAIHLDYDFWQPGAPRAAYAETELPIRGEPLAMSVDVYGDNHDEWLRGAYRNADGIVDSVTISRHVDWTGWKTIRMPVPPQVRWPIVWTRLYAVEPRRDAVEAGDLWFRNLTALYPGPSGLRP